MSDFKNKKFKLKMQILDRAYLDSLITALVHQGYAVYYHSDDSELGALYFEFEGYDLVEMGD